MISATKAIGIFSLFFTFVSYAQKTSGVPETKAISKLAKQQNTGKYIELDPSQIEIFNHEFSSRYATRDDAFRVGIRYNKDQLHTISFGRYGKDLAKNEELKLMSIIASAKAKKVKLYFDPSKSSEWGNTHGVIALQESVPEDSIILVLKKELQECLSRLHKCSGGNREQQKYINEAEKVLKQTH